MPVRIDLSNQRFNKLTVIERAPNSKNGQGRWLCRCDCNNITIIQDNNLKLQKSCGCLKKGNSTHGLSGIPEYRIWSNIIQRTTNPNVKNYSSYGGRGITVCARWRKFENFLEDMGNRPEGLTIERIDNNKGYSPDNCKWATLSTQQRNKRNNRHITINGVTKILVEWIEKSAISRHAFYGRKKKGLSDREALGL